MVLLLVLLGFGLLLLFITGAINVLIDPMRIEEEESANVQSDYI